MSPDHLKVSAKMLRDIADKIESGKWGSVNVEVENNLRDKPRTWRDGARYRGKDLVGRTATVHLALHASGGEG